MTEKENMNWYNAKNVLVTNSLFSSNVQFLNLNLNLNSLLVKRQADNPSPGAVTGGN